MTPAAAIFGVLAVLLTVSALLPVAASAFFRYRAGERLTISIGAIAGLFADVMRPIGLPSSYLSAVE
jgi:hypothetical protein